VSHYARLLGTFALVVMSCDSLAESTTLHLRAAGSLRAVMTEISAAFTASGGVIVESNFGASGLVRQGIEKGDPTDIFASADVGNAQILADAGRSSAPIVLARNRLCALVAPGIDVTVDTLLERMLDPSVKLGTSTPKAEGRIELVVLSDTRPARHVKWLQRLTLRIA
jgi:molybdate transport system substrate-binding protein